MYKPLNNAGNQSASDFYGFLGIKSPVSYSLIKVSVVILCNVIKISIILSSNPDMLLLMCGRAELNSTAIIDKAQINRFYQNVYKFNYQCYLSVYGCM
jgi:hypothetical protein